MSLFRDPRSSAYIAGNGASLVSNAVTRLKLPVVALLLHGRLSGPPGTLGDAPCRLRLSRRV